MCFLQEPRCPGSCCREAFHLWNPGFLEHQQCPAYKAADWEIVFTGKWPQGQWSHLEALSLAHYTICKAVLHARVPARHLPAPKNELYSLSCIPMRLPDSNVPESVRILLQWKMMFKKWRTIASYLVQHHIQALKPHTSFIWNISIPSKFTNDKNDSRILQVDLRARLDSQRVSADTNISSSLQHRQRQTWPCCMPSLQELVY